MHTLYSFIQAAGGAIPSGPWELITHASTMTQVVLGILAVLSLLSWSIMFGVWRSLAKATGAAEKFWREFERARSIDEAGAVAKRSPPGALPRLFMHAMHFVSDARVASQQMRERSTPIVGDAPTVATLSGSQLETLHLLLESEASDERDRMSRFLPWLATIGSASPLIGLLGTGCHEFSVVNGKTPAEYAELEQRHSAVLGEVVKDPPVHLDSVCPNGWAQIDRRVGVVDRLVTALGSLIIGASGVYEADTVKVTCAAGPTQQAAR